MRFVSAVLTLLASSAAAYAQSEDVGAPIVREASGPTDSEQIEAIVEAPAEQQTEAAIDAATDAANAAEHPAAAPVPTCRNVTAPADFEMNQVAGQATQLPLNQGIVPTGFVDLPNRRVVHGIDVSKWQENVDFGQIYACGGRFAYVRLSGGTSPDNELLYRTHWANVRASGLLPGPYHNLNPMAELSRTLVTAAVVEIEQAVAANLEQARASSAEQAQLFIDRLNEVRSLDPLRAETPPPFLPLALDLSYRPLAAGTPEQRRAFGSLVGEMVCSFIDTVRASEAYGAFPIILFLDPADYLTYGLDAPPCELSNTMLWLRHRPSDGSDVFSALNAELIARLCQPAQVNARMTNQSAVGRCIMEQYTSYGGFAVFEVGSPLDLDRFFGSEQDLARIAVGGSQ